MIKKLQGKELKMQKERKKSDERLDEFYDFIKRWKKNIVPYNIMQRDGYKRTIYDVDEIEFCKIYVDTCLYYYKDLKVDVFPSDIIYDLKLNLKLLKELLEKGQYDHKRWKRSVPFEICIEDAEVFLKSLTSFFDGDELQWKVNETDVQG